MAIQMDPEVGPSFFFQAEDGIRGRTSLDPSSARSWARFDASLDFSGWDPARLGHSRASDSIRSRLPTAIRYCPGRSAVQGRVAEPEPGQLLPWVLRASVSSRGLGLQE